MLKRMLSDLDVAEVRSSCQDGDISMRWCDMGNPVRHQADCLLPGSKARVYKPLWERQTCGEETLPKQDYDVQVTHCTGKTGNFVCSNCKFPESKGKDYCDICCKTFYFLRRFFRSWIYMTSQFCV